MGEVKQTEHPLPGVKIVDCHGRPIGEVVESSPPLGEGSLEVEVRDAIRDLHELDSPTLELPGRLVAGVRRDEVRLAIGSGDPLFRGATEGNRRV